MMNFFYQAITSLANLSFHLINGYPFFLRLFFCSASQPKFPPEVLMPHSLPPSSFCPGKCRLFPGKVARPLSTPPSHLSCCFSCYHNMDEWLKSFSLQTQLLYPLEHWAYKCLATDSEQDYYLHLNVNVPKLTTPLPFPLTISWVPKGEHQTHKSTLLGTQPRSHLLAAHVCYLCSSHLTQSSQASCW